MIRVLVVGCGSIGERHLRVLQQVPGVEPVPVEPRPEKRALLRETYDLREEYESFEQADLGAFDAVFVCTPSNQHIGYAQAAAEAGCHVFVEKPLSTTLEGVDALIAGTRQRGLVLQVGYVLRHHPNTQDIERWIQEGALGEVRAASYIGGYDVAQARPDYRGTYWQRRLTGGGAIWDASHQIDLFEWFVGPIVEVSAFGTRISELEVEAAVEDAATVCYRFETGALASAMYNHFRRDRRGIFELVGSEGSVIWDYDTTTATLYRHATKTYEARSYVCERDDFYLAQARNFIAAVRGEAEPRVTGEDGKASLLVALACYRSMAESRAVKVEEIGR